MTDVLDLSDPHVRAMADLNHRPDEAWSNAGRLIAVSCKQCGQAWPCATRQALTALNADQFRPCPHCGTARRVIQVDVSSPEDPHATVDGLEPCTRCRFT